MKKEKKEGLREKRGGWKLGEKMPLKNQKKID